LVNFPITHHQPCCDPDPGLRRQVGCCLQSADRLDELQPGPHGSLGDVLVGARIAEIGEHAVAHVFCDEPACALDHAGTAAAVSADHAAQILRVEPHQKRGRADQVAEQYGHLSPLGFLPGNGPRGRRARFDCGCRSQSRNRAQQAPPDADQADTELSQILRRQAWQQIGGYPVLVEGRRVLVKPQPPQPFRISILALRTNSITDLNDTKRLCPARMTMAGTTTTIRFR
jgi:hypothetical protein